MFYSIILYSLFYFILSYAILYPNGLRKKHNLIFNLILNQIAIFIVFITRRIEKIMVEKIRYSILKFGPRSKNLVLE